MMTSVLAVGRKADVMTRSTVAALIVISVCGSSSPLVAQTAADNAAVRKLVDDQYRFFGDRKAVAYGNLFMPTATFITVDGMKMDGKAEIIEGNALFFGMIDTAKNDVVYRNLTITFLDSKTAVTYSVWDGLWTKPAINDRAQSGYLTMIMHKVKNRWLIASATNAFNWRGTPNYDLTEYEVFRAQMIARSPLKN